MAIAAARSSRTIIRRTTSTPYPTGSFDPGSPPRRCRCRPGQIRSLSSGPRRPFFPTRTTAMPAGRAGHRQLDAGRSHRHRHDLRPGRGLFRSRMSGRAPTTIRRRRGIALCEVPDAASAVRRTMRAPPNSCPRSPAAPTETADSHTMPTLLKAQLVIDFPDNPTAASYSAAVSDDRHLSAAPASSTC